MAGKKKMEFDEGMALLEQLVGQLEKGELSLEKSFAAYEQGIKLADALKEQLDAGEKRVMELTASGERPFAEDEA